MNAEAAKCRIEQDLRFLTKGIIHTSDIAVELVSLGSAELSFATALIEQLPEEFLVDVFGFLNFYPITDYGWSQLPHSRPNNREQFTVNENRDIQHAQFQEDRAAVEHCR